MRLTHNTARRGGFTLVELLVAAALCVVIMAILATAFGAGMQTLSHLKSVVGLSEQLRTAEAVISRDLNAPHLTSATGEVVRVSDPRLHQAWQPPNEGFFRVYQAAPTAASGTAPGENEGFEGGVTSIRATGQVLAFTSRLSGSGPSEVFVGDAPGLVLGQSLSDHATGAQFAGRGAEIVYFLHQTGTLLTTTEDTDGDSTEQFHERGVPLFSLRRRQRVLLPTSVTQTLPTTVDPNDSVNGFPEMSVSAQPTTLATATTGTGRQVRYNDMLSVIDPNNRLTLGWNYATGTANGTRFNQTTNTMALTGGNSAGSDVLLTNVISFQILTMPDEVPALPAGAPAVTPAPVANRFNDYLPRMQPGAAATDWDYDTALANQNTNAARKPVLRAIQLKLRIYDPKNRMTRQMTIAADL